MVVVSKTITDNHPEIVREVHRLLTESAAHSPAGPRFEPAEMRRSLQMITRYAAQQKLIPREYAVDELFDNATRALR
jgi:4,5-dihydroxyphthalate decarboxylase